VCICGLLHEQQERGDMKSIPIRYCFTFTDRTQEIINLRLNPKTLELANDRPGYLPSWTVLGFHQCPNCPLSHETDPHCPLAVHLVNTVNRFQGKMSFHEIHLSVVTPERIFSQPTTLQNAISSLMGLISATCGCPLSAPLRPMARFHLPLATGEETIYRATSMYLLAQYFLKKNGQCADLELAGLTRVYQDIHLMNISFTERLKDATQTESTLDALIMLDTFAKVLPIQIEDSLDCLSYLFDQQPPAR